MPLTALDMATAARAASKSARQGAPAPAGDGVAGMDLLISAPVGHGRFRLALVPRSTLPQQSSGRTDPMSASARTDTPSTPTPPAALAPGGDATRPDRAARDAELAELLRAAGRGNAGAFEVFYDRTVGYASAFARRMVKPDDLDDVLSDAFFQAWREAARFDVARGSAVTWLLTLVRSRALDLLRQRRHAAVEQSSAELPERASDLPGPDEVLALARDGSRLHAALATLSTNERWVLGLAYFRELTHQQIADCTGLPLGSVKSLILRSQARLRGQLGTE